MSLADLPAGPVGPWRATSRLVRLYLTSRQIPSALAALAGCGLLLALTLHQHWIEGADPVAQRLPLLAEAAAAAIIAVAAHNPFGESERITGPRLLPLWFGSALALSAAAFGALAAGSTAGQLPGGATELLRNLAGLIGIGLAGTAVFGGALSWVGLPAYLAPAEFALGAGWQSPLTWPARPPHDLGAGLCSGLVYAAGLALLTVRGARDQQRD